MSPKELKKLAKTCREAGIKSYKCAEFEFVLTDELPEPKKSIKAALPISYPEEKLVSEDLTEEQLLMWSAGNIPDSESIEQ